MATPADVVGTREASDMTKLPLPCQTQLVFIGMMFSILSRAVFIVVLVRNRSTNWMSCTVCLLNVCANAFWIPYSLTIGSKALLGRSVTDVAISAGGVFLIVFNVYHAHAQGRHATERAVHATSISSKPFRESIKEDLIKQTDDMLFIEV